MINTWFDSEVYGGAKKSNFAKQDLFYAQSRRWKFLVILASLQHNVK